MNSEIEFKVTDKVLLPFDETGTIVEIKEYAWMTKYYVKIRKSNGFNKTNQIVDFFKKHLKLEKI